MIHTINEKREYEKEIVTQMISIYCRNNHHCKKGELCPECQQLADYACFRTDKCPFMETKTFCSNCKVHCYKPDMKERIRKVMRYSGPRMIFYHPIVAIKHVYYSMKEKKAINKKSTK